MCRSPVYLVHPAIEFEMTVKVREARQLRLICGRIPSVRAHMTRAGDGGRCRWPRSRAAVDSTWILQHAEHLLHRTHP